LEVPVLRLLALALATIALCLAISMPGSALADDEGATTYKTFCVTCHGDTGKGDGVAGAALDPKAADFTTPGFFDSRDEDHLKKVVKEGGAAVGKSPLMAAWGAVLSDEQVAKVVAHILTFKVDKNK
jgi:cytochrome c553